MPHYGILRDHKMENVDDLRGADVYGVNDEKLGSIDDVIFDHSSGDIRYIVLKTGGLLSRKKVMVPANRVEPYGNHDDKFYAELDKERLEMLPEFKEETMKAQGEWSTYEKDYEKRWNDGAVMYNKNTGRIITPPLEQVQQARRIVGRRRLWNRQDHPTTAEGLHRQTGRRNPAEYRPTRYWTERDGPAGCKSRKSQSAAKPDDKRS
jgi:sporulation protein YlmC with PRC-barrel domain